jgi:microcystin degradation protein MlrC
MARIGIAGFMHETNTFAPTRTGWAAFADAVDRPRLQRGNEMLATFADVNVGVGGAAAELEAKGHAVVPLVWAGATPAGYVTADAYEQFMGILLESIANAGSLDALYLNLHGAMVAEHFEDGEGELLARVRAVVGNDMPIVVSLDLHSNTTPAMFALADVLIGYRTYPHIDMRDTGTRSARLLDQIIRRGAKPAKAYRQAPFLIPLTWQCTSIEPNLSIYRDIAALEAGEVASASFTAGFPMADIAHCGPAIMAYAWDANAAADAADRLILAVTAREPDFAGKVYSPEEAAVEAMRLARGASRPIVLADTQDNPGAGGTSDTTGLLDALIRRKAEDTVVAILHDAEAAAKAHAAGVGATLTLPLGGRSGPEGVAPVIGSFTVAALGSGDFVCTGPMWGGSRQRLGPMALLRTGGVSVIVSTGIAQAGDQAMLRHLGVEPARQRIIALKSSVHFRADFEPIAEKVLVVESPGYAVNDPATLPFKNLRPGLRIKPLGQSFQR